MSIMPLIVSDAKDVTTLNSLSFCLVGPLNHTVNGSLGFILGTGRKWQEKLLTVVCQVSLARGRGTKGESHTPTITLH